MRKEHAHTSALALAGANPSSRGRVIEPAIRWAALEATDGAFASRWTEFLARTEYGHLQQSYEFARLKDESGWSATFFWTEEGDFIVAGAVLLEKKLHPLPWSMAMIPCGPSWMPGREARVQDVLRQIERHCRSNGVIFCRLNTHCPDEVFEGLRPHLPRSARRLKHIWSYWNLARDVMRVDISGSRAEVFRKMHRDTRMKCGRGARRGLNVRASGSGDVPGFVALMQSMGARKKILIRDQAYFTRLLSVFPPERIRLFVAVDADGTLAGASLVASVGRTAWYLYGAMDYEKRNLYPSEALQAAMIDWAREQGCLVYDMGGTCTDWPPKESEKGHGVYKFKARLGAEAVIMAPYCDLVFKPVLYKLARAAENVGMPLVLERGAQKFRVIARKVGESF